MRKTRPLALVAAGPVSRTFLARLPAVAEQLGPVKSTSHRLASRIANSLRAGHAVSDYKDFAKARLVFISVPPRSLPKAIAELAAAPIDWRRKCVVLCDGRLEYGILAPLAALGAAVASLAPLESSGEKRLLAEGDKAALTVLRALLAHGGIRLLELHRQRKGLYLAGVTFLSSLLTPMMTAANDCFRLAGLSRQVTAQLIERLVQRALRTHLKSGRKGWAGIPASGELESLQRMPGDLAANYADASRIAIRVYRRGKARVAPAGG